MKTAIAGERPALGATEARFQSCQGCESLLEPHMRVSRSQSNADLVVAYSGGIALAALAPVHFHAVAPGRDAEVSAKGKTQPGLRSAVKAGPAPDPRVESIGAHDPARTHDLAAERD